jgi:Protein of unknown function (DUF732)
MIIKLPLLAAGVFAAVAAFAAPAHADEDSYIAELDERGVPYTSRSAAIHFGNVICQRLEADTPFDTVANMITSGGFYTSKEAGLLIGSAVGGLCPAEEPSLDAQAQIAESDEWWSWGW